MLEDLAKGFVELKREEVLKPLKPVLKMEKMRSKYWMRPAWEWWPWVIIFKRVTCSWPR